MTNWTNYQASLQYHLAHDDLSDFLQWSTIQATMFVGNAPYVFEEYDDLLSCDNWKKYTDAITEPGIGNPKYFMVESPYSQPVSIPEYRTSGNLIHQMYHLKQWLDKTKQDLSKMSSIVEIGAGYGAMALLCYRLGFDGRYYIIDLSELVRIQRYYLWKTIANIDEIWWTLPLESCDLFIASHSLGEMPIIEREKYLSQVTAKEYLFASSYEYEEVDNQVWFNQLAGTIDRDWTFYSHPYQENAFYQVGVEI